MAGSCNQRREQAVFSPGQDELLARHRRGVAATVEHDRAPAQLSRTTRLRLVAAAPHHGSDARQEFLLAERLDHVVVRARVERLHFGALVGLAGEDDDRRLRHAPDGAAHLHPVKPRHGQVQQHQVWALLGEATEGGVSIVGRDHAVSGATDQSRNSADHRRLVVDDEDQQARLRHRTH